MNYPLSLVYSFLKEGHELKLDETSELGDFGSGASHWQSGGGFGGGGLDS